AIASVETAHSGPGLSETRVLCGDGQVAHHMEHMAPADRVARHHRDDRLGQASDLNLEVEPVQPAGAAGIDLALFPPHTLAAPRAERFSAGPGQDDHADLGVV